MESGLKSIESELGMRKNQTLICAPLMADTVDELVKLMHKAKAKEADIVEIRLDHLKSFDPHADIEKLIKECPLPTLFTYRFDIPMAFYDFLCLQMYYRSVLEGLGKCIIYER